jgi:hypothetical protein
MRIAAARAIATRTSQSYVWRAGCCAAQTTLQINKKFLLKFQMQTFFGPCAHRKVNKGKGFSIFITVCRKIFG